MRLPEHAIRIIGLLEAAGFEGYAVGGYVRDQLLGRAGNDVDITTDAHCDDVHRTMEAVGAHVFDTGAAHGTVTVVLEGAEPVEVTTYRVDGPYLDGRHPEFVRFTASIEEDLARRDFTINAMAFNPRTGLVDPFGGRADLDAGIIRCVGDARERFLEDALRILRALRFAAQLGFTLEDATADALLRQATTLTLIARERIGAEFTKLLCGEDVRPILTGYRDVMGIIIPELVPEFGFEQHNDHHIYDVWGHTVIAVDTIAPDPVLRYAALLHDIGKPETYSMDAQGVGHFWKHAPAGEPLARRVCESLRLPAAWTDEICHLVKHHSDGLLPEGPNLRHAMNRLGPDTVRRLIALKRADVSALAPSCYEALPFFDKIEQELDRVIEEQACFKVADLAVDGNDLLSAGVPQGPAVGETLRYLLDLVIDEKVANGYDALIAVVRERMQRDAALDSPHGAADGLRDAADSPHGVADGSRDAVDSPHGAADGSRDAVDGPQDATTDEGPMGEAPSGGDEGKREPCR